VGEPLAIAALVTLRSLPAPQRQARCWRRSIWAITPWSPRGWRAPAAMPASI
jgi:hypothetical protein